MLRPVSFLIALLALNAANAEVTPQKVDVCVYGATPAGIVAAVTARQEGCSVLIVEPSRWVGGILGAGIKPMQDCAAPQAVGGLTLEQAVRAPEYGAPLVVIGAPLAVDSDAFRTADGNLEGTLRIICERVHGFGDVAVGRARPSR
mgnify:CR=1 FL=1